MIRPRIGVQLQQRGTSSDALRRVWRDADAMGLDSIWVWDHFFSPMGDPAATNFEAYTLLAAMAVETQRARIGALVTCNSYRNPDLLADMARTIDHLSAGRFSLGLGSGWFERDFAEYGYEFGTARRRLDRLVRDVPRIKARLAALAPGPIGGLPIVIGGTGERITLRLVAEHADGWNAYGSPRLFAAKSAVLDAWCERLGRDPKAVERTALIPLDRIAAWPEYAQAGADHLIVAVGPPFDLRPIEQLIAATRSREDHARGEVGPTGRRDGAR